MGRYTVSRIEKRRRGLLGVLVAAVFWLFNLVMAALVVVPWLVVAGDPPEAAAQVAGGFLAASWWTTAALSIWFIGAVILGIMMLVTRGKKIVLTRNPDR